MASSDQWRSVKRAKGLRRRRKVTVQWDIKFNCKL